MSADGRVAALASGLVSSSTSHQAVDVDPASNPEVFEIDRDLGRLSRMRARVCEAANLHEKGTRLRPAMVTLTYADAAAWRPNHLRAALHLVRQWLRVRGHRFRYVWTAELQARGAIHYHVLCWLPTGADKPPFWDAQGWWPHGHSQSEWARNAVGYMVKYVSKIGSKDRLPSGARMHGSGGFMPDERRRMSWHGRPAWLRQLSSAAQRCTRRDGGGWVQRFACGLRRVVDSPYLVLSVFPLRLCAKASPTGRHAAALINLRTDHGQGLFHVLA